MNFSEFKEDTWRLGRIAAPKMSLSEIGEWLLEFFQRFDDEVKLLLKEEPFWEVCHQCPDGYCCSKPTLPIMGEEWLLIQDYVKQNFSRQSKKRLLENIERARLQCIFLFGNRCSVYSVRPWACRIYPYTISFHTSPITFQVGGVALPSCPTLASAFGLKQDQLFFHYPNVLSRHSSRLVKCKLKKHKPLWLIDGSDYFRKYEAKMPKNEEGTLDGSNMHEWVEFAKLAKQKGYIDNSKFLSSFGLD